MCITGVSVVILLLLWELPNASSICSSLDLFSVWISPRGVVIQDLMCSSESADIFLSTQISPVWKVSIRKRQMWNKVLRRRKAFLIKVCEHAWIHLERVFNFWKHPDEVGEIRKSSSWGIFCFVLGLTFLFAPLVACKDPGWLQGVMLPALTTCVFSLSQQLLLRYFCDPNPSFPCVFLTGRESHEEINITFTLPAAWNSDECVLHGHCEQVVFSTCMTVTAASSVFPVTVWVQLSPGAASCLTHSSELLDPPGNSCWSWKLHPCTPPPRDKTFVTNPLLSLWFFGPCLPFKLHWEQERICGNLRDLPLNWVSEMRFDTEVLTLFPAERSAQGKGCFAFTKISSLCLLWIPWHCSSNLEKP